MPSSPKIKTFAADRLAQLPRPWLEATGSKIVHAQGSLIVVAATKTAVSQTLAAAGVHPSIAASLAHGSRVVHDGWVPLARAIASGAINTDEPGIYVWHRGVLNDRIVRVSEGGTCTVVGEFFLDDVRNLDVRKVAAA